MLDAHLVTFVLNALPGTPARVLEIGAGSGELAEHLRGHGYDVLAIDPASRTQAVESVALAELDAPAASFDAALAVLSLHHVDPLAESCERLATVVRPGGALVVDEFDIGTLDSTAAQWWLSQGPAIHDHDRDVHAMVAEMRAHLHPFDRVLAALEPWFELGETEPGPYLYRWHLEPGLRPAEEEQIEAGLLRATGARVVGRRRTLDICPKHISPQ